MGAQLQISLTDLNKQILDTSQYLQNRQDNQLERILQLIAGRFDRVEVQISNVDAKISRVEKDLGAQINNVDAKISRVEKDLGAQIGKVEKDLGAQINNVDAKISRVEKDLGAQIGKVEKDLGAQIGKVEKDLGAQMGKVENEVAYIRAAGTVIVVLATLAFKVPPSVWENLGLAS
jgi:hypothetical protein